MTTTEEDRRLRHVNMVKAAEAAYDRQLALSRLPLADPKRVPYTEAMQNALAAYAEVMNPVDGSR